MNIRYIVTVEDPKNHLVKVKFSFDNLAKNQELTTYLPSWSPGSYLMREYAKDIRTFKALDEKGRYLDFKQTSKNEWLIKSADSERIECEYEVFCHQLTVRTSHIDESHAFLHGPSYLLGLEGGEGHPCDIEFRFPPIWSKLTIGLKSLRDDNVFAYRASNYDVLLDAPVEIGCHETDGFEVDGKPHHLAFYGEAFPHNQNLKADIKKIVESVSGIFGELPYDDYHFITHFKANLYGGLEHLNSTAVQFDGRKLGNRKDYLNWLGLISHEYFHTWNVKRIRPEELGPFDYRNENYTSMHWLTEGLTSFIDELYVLRSGLCTLEEYLEMQAKNLRRYFAIPGRKFHSLEQSSFNAWVKLYRPDENSLNSSISYYLKGGLVFSTLFFEMKKHDVDITTFLQELWRQFKIRPEQGLNKDEVLNIIRELTNDEITEMFESRLSTTEEIDFETYYKEIGIDFTYNKQTKASLDVDYKFDGDRVFLSKVHLDGSAYKSGLNAGDEIISIDNQRMLKADMNELEKMVDLNKTYSFVVSRLGALVTIPVIFGLEPKTIKSLVIKNKQLATKTFLA